MITSKSLILVMMGSFIVLISGPGSVAAPGLEVFVSAEGGIEVLLPSDWHHKEIPGDGVYQGVLSREPVETKEDVYLYGLSVLRLKDYRRVFEFSSDSPAAMTLEYANRIAAGFQNGQNIVISMPTDDRAMGMSLFRIGGGGGTDECTSMWLLAGVKRKQWFHALWEIPCSERKSHEEEINEMITSLKVDPKWAKNKK